MSSPNPHLFEEPYWLIYDAIGWIRYRSKDEFGKVITIRDFRAAVIYKSPDFPNLNPAKALLHALQLGHIQGIKKGGELVPPEYWAGRKLADVHDVYLRSAGVLELWPLQAAEQAPGPQQPQAHAPEAAQPARETTPHVDEQETLNPVPDASPARKPGTKKRRNRRKHKRDTILQGLVAVYPNGYHPSITPSIAKIKVTPWLEENHPGFVPKTEQGLPIDTVRRALAVLIRQAGDFGWLG